MLFRSQQGMVQDPQPFPNPVGGDKPGLCMGRDAADSPAAVLGDHACPQLVKFVCDQGDFLGHAALFHQQFF